MTLFCNFRPITEHRFGIWHQLNTGFCSASLCLYVFEKSKHIRLSELLSKLHIWGMNRPKSWEANQVATEMNRIMVSIKDSHTNELGIFLEPLHHAVHVHCRNTLHSCPIHVPNISVHSDRLHYRQNNSQKQLPRKPSKCNAPAFSILRQEISRQFLSER